jgi:hypothetical protein
VGVSASLAAPVTVHYLFSQKDDGHTYAKQARSLTSALAQLEPVVFVAVGDPSEVRHGLGAWWAPMQRITDTDQ